MDQDWDTTLTEFIPKIINAPDALSYHLAFKELTTRINDSHAFFNSPVFRSWRGSNFPSFLARHVENQMVITKALPGSPVDPGDIIKRIDNEDIEKIRASLRKYAHGSNEEFINRTLNQYILWGPPGEFSLTVSSGSAEKTVTLSRNTTNISSLNSDDSPIWTGTMTHGGCHFGIVDMGRLEITQVSSMFNDLWNTDAIIFDIRNYPNGTLWTIVDFLFRTSINIANFTVPDNTYPGRLSWDNVYIGSGTSSPYSGKIVILFDERTLSQAEYTVMGLEQFPGAIKIGSTTAAADGNVASIYLPGQIQTNATFLGVYYPDYSPTQRIGIIPDIELRPTIQGIRDLEDEVMNFALNCEVLDLNREISDHEIISLYPNPVRNNLNYKSSIDKPIIFEIYDVLGRKLITLPEAVPSGTIDISYLSSGIYFLKTTSDSTTQLKKFIKIK